MNKLVLPVLAIMMGAGPAFAQTATDKPNLGTPQEKPLDRGPFTPDADKAFNGGGVILQGAPGAPAPVPQALPAAPSGTGAPASR